jgi:hypothetical protein
LGANLDGNAQRFGSCFLLDPPQQRAPLPLMACSVPCLACRNPSHAGQPLPCSQRMTQSAPCPPPQARWHTHLGLADGFWTAPLTASSLASDARSDNHPEGRPRTMAAAGSSGLRWLVPSLRCSSEQGSLGRTHSARAALSAPPCKPTQPWGHFLRYISAPGSHRWCRAEARHASKGTACCLQRAAAAPKPMQLLHGHLRCRVQKEKPRVWCQWNKRPALRPPPWAGNASR